MAATPSSRGCHRREKSRRCWTISSLSRIAFKTSTACYQKAAGAWRVTGLTGPWSTRSNPWSRTIMYSPCRRCTRQCSHHKSPLAITSCRRRGPSQMTPHAQLPHRPTYSLTEHKHNNKRRGVSLDPSPSGRSSAARYADPPRKRAAPPGRCHSCNRVDTPEWRRGPDGARTLCNACGLHYAKLERKKATELKSIRPKPSGSATQA